MKKCFLVAALVLFGLAHTAMADLKAGIAPGFASFSIDDPDGDTDDAGALVPFSLALTYDLDHKTRIYSVFSYLDYDLDAGTGNIGQDVTAYQLTCAYQYLVKFSYTMQFYLGAGLAYTSAEFKNRHRVDSDGYLAERYGDREENIFSLVVNISREWELSPKFDLGFDASYQHALQSEGMSGFKGALTLFYKF